MLYAHVLSTNFSDHLYFKMSEAYDNTKYLTEYIKLLPNSSEIYEKQ